MVLYYRPTLWFCTMDLLDGFVIWTYHSRLFCTIDLLYGFCTIDLLYGFVLWTYTMVLYYRPTLWFCTIDLLYGFVL